MVSARPSYACRSTKYVAALNISGTARSAALRRLMLSPSSSRRRPAVARQPQLEMPPHVGPLGGENAVHDGVAHRPVAPQPPMPDHAVLVRAERLDRPLRSQVEADRI